MPGISEHPKQELVKVLLLGNSGAGKTVCLAALANAGYNFRILDFDNGLQALVSFLEPKAYDRVHYVTLTDQMQGLAGKFVPKGVPASTANAMKLLNNWKPKDLKLSSTENDESEFGPVASWTKREVIVIDSLTFQGNACLRHVLAANGRIGQPTRIQDWGEAMGIQEGLLQLLFSDAVACNVVVTCHLIQVGGEDNVPIQFLPSALGNKLAPKVPRYFDSMLAVRTRGSGSTQKRYLRTVSEPGLELKNPAPKKVPQEIPLEIDDKGYARRGLAEYFELVTGYKPK